MPSLQHERQAKAAPATDSGRLPGQVAIRVPARRSGKTLRRYAEVVALLMKKPRSIAELHEELGVTYTGNGVHVLIHALRAEGLVYVADWTRDGHSPRPVFAWQPSVCAYVDAAKPVWKRPSRSRSSTWDVARDLASEAVEINE
jgi:predicted ArsR family transcriptional regulator